MQPVLRTAHARCISCAEYCRGILANDDPQALPAPAGSPPCQVSLEPRGPGSFPAIMAPHRASPVTPPRRNPGRQARHSDESSQGAPRNPYRTPTRLSARLQQSAPESAKRARSDTSTDYENDDADYEAPARRVRRSSKGAKSSPEHRYHRSPPRSMPSPRKKKPGRPRKDTAGLVQTASGPPKEAIIPDWQGSLPYFIWVEILDYAAADTGPFGINANWLIQTARVCHALADPAMTVLYQCPPVRTEHKVASLVTNLRRPVSRLKFNYRTKIRSLHLDISMVALARDTYGGPLNLIQNLPKLREIHIVHPYDLPPYRNLTVPLRWTYHQSIFDSLDAAADASSDDMDKTSPTRLQSWIWNARMMKPGSYVDGVEKILELHNTTSFSSLRKLRFVNFQLPSFSLDENSTRSRPAHVQALMDANDKEYVEALAGTLAVLPQLEHLAFESSTAVNPTLLPLLPTNLRHLELINCWEIPGDVFASFLMSHGSHIESLTLHHNQALNLSFLTTLGASCPRLKQLRMNMFYYRHHEFLDDSDPFYDFLLLDDQIPHWPSTLQVVDLENLRGWSLDAADMFFQSLADSAKDLPDLRYLSVKAMLNISWRQRSQVRHGWQDTLRKIFLRPYVPPESLTTLRVPTQKPVEPVKSRTEPSRRSNRLSGETLDGQPARGNGRARGLRALRRPKYEESESGKSDEETEETDTDASSPGTDATRSEASRHTPSESQPFIHGLCDVVDISIDNQKPRELQFNMGDFVDELDTEGDETDGEWNG